MFLIGKDIVQSCFFIQSDNLCLLTDVFRPFIFDAITNMVRFKSIILQFVSIHPVFFFPPFFRPSFELNELFSDFTLFLLMAYYL